MTDNDIDNGEINPSEGRGLSTPNLHPAPHPPTLPQSPFSSMFAVCVGGEGYFLYHFVFIIIV